MRGVVYSALFYIVLRNEEKKLSLCKFLCNLKSTVSEVCLWHSQNLCWLGLEFILKMLESCTRSWAREAVPILCKIFIFGV